jgi:hypothetical protein
MSHMVRRAALVLTAALAVPATAGAQADAHGPWGHLPVFPSSLACADVPVFGTGLPDSPRIIAVQDGNAQLRTAYADPDVLTLDRGTGAGVEVGQQFFVRRVTKGPSRQEPSARFPGAVHTAAWITVVAADERYALAKVVRACDVIRPGDYLEPYAQPTLPTAWTPANGAPGYPDMAKVLFGRDGRLEFANGDVFAIDRGSSKGLTAGTRLVFYRDIRRGGPLVEVGEGVTVAVTAETATVAATSVKDSLRAGDWVAIRSAEPPTTGGGRQ